MVKQDQIRFHDFCKSKKNIRWLWSFLWKNDPLQGIQLAKFHWTWDHRSIDILPRSLTAHWLDFVSPRPVIGWKSGGRNRLNSSCRSLLVRRSFFLKGAPNHGKRYAELPKAILLKCNQFIHVCVQSLELFFFFHILASPKAIPEAIPLRYPSGR